MIYCLWTDGSRTARRTGWAWVAVPAGGDEPTAGDSGTCVGTSNVAELTAVVRGLQSIEPAATEVIVRTDSQYAIGVLSGRHRARANLELVLAGRAVVAALALRGVRVRWAWVPGHSGYRWNEWVDQLAKGACDATK